MIQAQCPGCATQVFLDCSCPAGHAANTGRHHPECDLSDIDGKVSCACCPEDHDHAASANACPGGHDDASCPEAPGSCRVWKGAIADVRHPHEATRMAAAAALGVSHEDPPPCPGGHCARGTDGCTVCRPLVLTVLPGSAEIVPAAG